MSNDRAPAWRGRIAFGALLALVTLVVFHDQLLFGSTYLFRDIGADTLNTFYPQLVHAARVLGRLELPGWSFNQGFGQSTYPANLGDPFNWILYALGPDRLGAAIAFVEILKALVAALLFRAFLRLRGATETTATVGALMYAFCGSVMVGGTWYIFSTAVVHAAALLLGYELLFRRRMPWPFALAVAATGAASAFNLYLFGLFLLAYLPVHWLESRASCAWEPRALVGAVIATGLVGIAIAAPTALPSAWEMLHSPRVAGDASLSAQLMRFPLLGLGDASYYATVALRGFGNDLLGTGSEFKGWSNYLEAPMHYCGLLALLLAPLGIALRTGRARAAYLALVVVALALHLLPATRYAFWLWAGDYFRTLSLFATLLVLALALRALDAVLRGARANPLLIGGTLVVLLVLLWYPYYPDGSTSLRINATLRLAATELLVLYSACVLALSRPKLRRIAVGALVFAVVAEIMVFSSASLAGRFALAREVLDRRIGYNDETVEALKLVRSRASGFFRLDKSYGSTPAFYGSLNDGMVQDYAGTSAYNSFNHVEYIRFLAALGVIDATDETQTRWVPGLGARPVLETFASVRFLLQRDDAKAPPSLDDHYDFVARVGRVAIFENRHFVPFGFTLSRTIPEREFLALDRERRDLALLRAVVVPDASAADYAAFPALDPDVSSEATAREALERDTRALAAGAMLDAAVRDGAISGRVGDGGARVLVFTMPFDAGWSARVDGVAAGLDRIDIGLTGVRVGPGPHRVELNYAVPLRRAGAAIGVLGLLALGALVALVRVARRPVASDSAILPPI